jgi:hypothetical protein
MSREREYEFLFVVDGVSIDDDEAVAILADAFDSVLSWNRGIYRLAVSGPGRDKPRGHSHACVLPPCLDSVARSSLLPAI